MAKKNIEIKNEAAEEEVVAPVESKTENKAKAEKRAKKQLKNSATQPKKSRAKETIGELKKVTWPSFSKTMKQTGMVLSLVLIFGVVVLGIDLLISFIINLLSSF